MICILKRHPAYHAGDPGEIFSWIIAVDCADARRQAEVIGDHDLAALLYRMEGPLEHTLPAQQDLPLPGPRYTMLRT